jgi:hypothetical protein
LSRLNFNYSLDNHSIQFVVDVQQLLIKIHNRALNPEDMGYSIAKKCTGITTNPFQFDFHVLELQQSGGSGQAYARNPSETVF